MQHLAVPYEQARLEAIESYQLMNARATQSLQNLVEMASLACSVPISYISIIDKDTQWIKAKKGLLLESIPRHLTLCQHVVSTRQPLIVSDFNDFPEYHKMIPTEKVGSVRSYAGFPINDEAGHVLGTLCIMDYRPLSLTGTQREMMELIARQCGLGFMNLHIHNTLKSIETLFSVSTDLIRICKKDGTIVKINPALTNILGWGQEEVKDKSIFEFMPSDSTAAARKVFDGLSADNAVLNITYDTIDKFGRTITLEWVGTYDADTDLIYAIGRDVTELEAQSKLLADNEKRFRMLFENSQTFMCLHDLNGNFLSMNNAGAASLGYTPQELLHASLFTIIPEDRHPLLLEYLKDIATKGHLKGVMQTRTKDGLSRRIWIYNNILFKDSDGNAYVIGNAIDVTERMKMEEDLTRTREMLEQTNRIARIGGWEINFTKQTAYWTKETRQICEVADDYVPQIKSGLEFFVTEESRNATHQATKTAVKGGLPYDLTLEMRTAKGKNLWVRMIASPIIDKNGRCVKILGTLQDVDEKEKTAETLKHAKRQAEQASKAKSEFLANMSHEIRTPLNGIIGFTDLMLKTELTETQKKYLSIVNESADSLLSIINDILDFSKIEAGKMEIITSQCDVYELASQAINIISYQSQVKGLKVLLNISPDLPRYIVTDDVRLKQILVNLLGNAVKFTARGTVALSLSTLKNAEENRLKMRFEISDTGIGIHPDKQQKIFQAFVQEDGGISKKYGGTGLGLAISSSLLKLMNSHLQLQSRLGQGSTFYFELDADTKTSTALEYKPSSNIQRVLAVDDNVASLTIIKEMLQLRQIETITARSGIEALKLLQQGERFDVIIVDYSMPVMNGIETIGKIRKDFYPTSVDQAIVILYSSNEDEFLKKACEELDITCRLMKPVKMTDLYHVFATLKKNKSAMPFKETEKPVQPANKQCSVLIAEDNEVNMLLTKTLVARILPGALLYEAVNGKEAVEKTLLLQPDIILMDVQMPEMNGIEATCIIRLEMNSGKQIPIIALTAGNVKSDRDNCLSAGMNDFMTKPIVEKTLKLMIEKWIGHDSEDRVHVDFEMIHTYAQDDHAFEQMLIKLAGQSLDDALQNIQLYIEKKDLQALKASAHKLKGTASTAGMIQVNKIAHEIEQMTSLDGKRPLQLLQRLQNEATVVKSILREKLD